MDQRKKLIELLTGYSIDTPPDVEFVADMLVANGVAVLSHVMLLDVEEDYGPLKIPKVVLFNENHVSQEEALRIVKAGEYHPSVLILPKSQWESLFLNRKEPEHGQTKDRQAAEAEPEPDSR